MDSYGITRSDKIIIVMGPTGAGKSTFINYAVEGKGESIGHGLKSYTQGIIIRKKVIKGESIVFIDTPGFNDTEKSDYDILSEIATFLVQAHENQIRLEKILYLHRVSDNRMAGSPLRNLELFASLCGNVALPSVIIVTTMWSLVPETVGEEREKQLRETFWRRLEEGGCEIARFYDNVDSARQIISLSPKRGQDTTLLTQELVEEGRKLNATEAGIMLNKQLENHIKDQKESSRKLKRLSQQQRNPAAKEQLVSEANAIEESIAQKVLKLRKMRLPFLDTIRRRFYKSKAPLIEGPSNQQFRNNSTHSEPMSSDPSRSTPIRLNSTNSAR
ncbi:hypothetical protein FRC20_012088 [Serendipita sp. 405]|nr:hypothetical protein FRC15_000477 [Serendipita sp. 397]KAG8791480.1 hypothetical protein FRC16_000395 [Serendipita sp. 398]KAG8858112.1 hypothetical protein FRC20_012088 [Serendipita sp. 405]